MLPLHMTVGLSRWRVAGAAGSIHRCDSFQLHQVCEAAVYRAKEQLV